MCNHGLELSGLQHPGLLLSGVSSWQQAQGSPKWRHSLSGAECNDKEKQPNKTLLQPEGTTYICKLRARFFKLFPWESPEKTPVKVRYVIVSVPAGWINSSGSSLAMSWIIFKVSSNSNCSVPLRVQNWPFLERHLTHSAHSEITEGTKHLSQVNFHIWSITGLPKTPSLHKDIMFLAAQKLVGVQKKLNPLYEISLQKAAGLEEVRSSQFWSMFDSAEPDFGQLSHLWV